MGRETLRHVAGAVNAHEVTPDAPRGTAPPSSVFVAAVRSEPHPEPVEDGVESGFEAGIARGKHIGVGGF